MLLLIEFIKLGICLFFGVFIVNKTVFNINIRSFWGDFRILIKRLFYNMGNYLRGYGVAIRMVVGMPIKRFFT